VVEPHVANVIVAGSSPVSRSILFLDRIYRIYRIRKPRVQNLKHKGLSASNLILLIPLILSDLLLR
jgi:hypothetical protein